MPRRKIVPLAAAFEGGLAVLAWGLGLAFGVPAFGALELAWPATAWGLVATAPLLASLVWVARARWPPIAGLRRTVDEVVGKLFAECTTLDFALVSLLAGIGEEALFRGLLQVGTSGVLGTAGALALASIGFGLVHYVSFTYAVYATAIGLYLGTLLLVFDNLLVPIVVHAAYDFIALAYLVHVRPAQPAASGD